VAQLAGGLVFGVGMALAGGCIVGILWKTGGGSVALAMLRPFPGLRGVERPQPAGW